MYIAGEFKKGKRDGQGKEVVPNGNVYEGGYMSDKRHGPGEK